MALAANDARYDLKFQIDVADWTRGVSSTLNGAIDADDTTITLASSSMFDARGHVIIDDEVIEYMANAGNVLTVAHRGLYWSNAAAHVTASTVQQIDPEDFQGFAVARDMTGGVPSLASGTSVLAQAGSEAPLVDVETIYDSPLGGIGWSRRGPDNVVAYGAPAWLRSARGIGPTPKLEELALPTVDGTFVDQGAFLSFETTDPTDQRSPYFLFGRYALKHPGGVGAALIVSQDFGPGYTARSWSNGYGSPVWVVSPGGAMWRLQGTWSQSAIGTAKAIAFASLTVGKGIAGASGAAGLPKDTWVVAHPTAPTIQWTMADPYAGPYYPGTPAITGSQAPIKSLISAPQAFGIIKEDGVWMHDGSRPLHLTPWARDDQDPDAGAAALFYSGFVVYSHPRFLALVPWTKDFQEHPWMGQPNAPPIPNRTPINGQAFALAKAHGWLYGAFYNEDEGQSYVCAALPRDVVGVDGIGPLVWYGAEQILPGKCTLLRPFRPQTGVATFGPPYMYAGVYDTSEGRSRLFRWRLASGGGDIYDDSSIEYAEDWECVFPRDDFGRQHAATNKMIRAYDVASEGPVDGISGVNLSAAVDDGAEVFQGTGTSPYTSFLAAEMLTGVAAEITARGHGTPFNPTVLNAIRAHATLIPKTVDRLDFWLDLGPSGESSESPTTFSSPMAAWRFLKDLEQRGSVTMVDAFGRWLVKVLPTTGRRPMTKLTADGWRMYAHIVVDVIEDQWLWDDGGPLVDGGGW